jgi:lysophospholipase L1-like esterase
LTRELGSEFRVIEEGLNARTTVREDPVEEYKNGKDYLRPCLESHRPLDVVIVALGVNDLKARFFASASDVADGAGVLVAIAQRSGAGPDGSPPAVLLMAPPPVGRLTELAEMFAGAEEKSRGFARQYRRVAEKYGCELLDAGEQVRASDLDGIHLEAGEHRKLGEAVAARVKGM